MLIDRYLPTFDETYIYEASINASPVDAYAAMKETNLRDPVVDLFFELRELPQRIARRWRGEPQPSKPAAITFGEIPKQGPQWLVLAETQDVELVIGAVGRFWQKDYGARAITAAEFYPFNEPGFAKLAISLSVRGAGTGTILRYEARTATTDEAARRTFRRYWRFIGSGVGIVMRRVVRRIKREAERRVPVAV
jgi:RimJ/RimL family protein N-acetyltransferase